MPRGVCARGVAALRSRVRDGDVMLDAIGKAREDARGAVSRGLEGREEDGDCSMDGCGNRPHLVTDQITRVAITEI